MGKDVHEARRLADKADRNPNAPGAWQYALWDAPVWVQYKAKAAQKRRAKEAEYVRRYLGGNTES